MLLCKILQKSTITTRYSLYKLEPRKTNLSETCYTYTVCLNQGKRLHIHVGHSYRALKQNDHKYQVSMARKWHHEEETRTLTATQQQEYNKSKASRLRGYKTFFLLNSTEHEFSTDHKTKTPTNEEVSCFKSLRCCIYHANKC